MSQDSFRRYLLRCEARVNGEVFTVQVQVDASLYDQDPVVRRRAEGQLRDQLLRRIMERFPPRVYRSG